MGQHRDQAREVDLGGAALVLELLQRLQLLGGDVSAACGQQHGQLEGFDLSALALAVEVEVGAGQIDLLLSELQVVVAALVLVGRILSLGFGLLAARLKGLYLRARSSLHYYLQL